MVGLTEAGEVLLNAFVDEFGRRRTDGLLEDGTRAFVISGGQVFEVLADAVAGAVSACLPQCVFGVGLMPRFRRPAFRPPARYSMLA